MLDHGESEAAGMGYAPLPKPVQEMVRKTITHDQVASCRRTAAEFRAVRRYSFHMTLRTKQIQSLS